MTAGFVEDFLNFREQNKDWEISFKQDTDVYEMASAKAFGNNTILTEQQILVCMAWDILKVMQKFLTRMKRY